jgi:hypothetical protein
MGIRSLLRKVFGRDRTTDTTSAAPVPPQAAAPEVETTKAERVEVEETKPTEAAKAPAAEPEAPVAKAPVTEAPEAPVVEAVSMMRSESTMLPPTRGEPAPQISAIFTPLACHSRRVSPMFGITS